MTEFQSGNATIIGNVSGAIPLPDSSQTSVNQYGSGNGATQNAYTVTTGKTLYVMAFIHESDVASRCIFYANDGTTMRAVCGSNASGTFVFHAGGMPVAVYTSGQVVKVNCTTAKEYWIIGVEV